MAAEAGAQRLAEVQKKRGGTAVKVGVVDDSRESREQLRTFIAQFARENGESIETVTADDGIHFVSDYQGDCDVLFLDIEMPMMDGITTAKRIREVDTTVSIVFLTNFSQYAINGYEVNAIDYVMKPITYFVFCQKLKKALAFSRRNQTGEIVVRGEQSVVRLPFSQICFIESERNYIVYHTMLSSYRERSTMRALLPRFEKASFALCNPGVLVNLAHVRKVVGSNVFVDGGQLQLSRSRKKEFMEKYIDYLSRGCC